MKPEDRVSIVLSRGAWTIIFQMVVNHIAQLVEQRKGDDPSWESEESAADRRGREVAIRDFVQKLVPVLFLASDSSLCGDMLSQSRKEIQRISGYVIPEPFEDAAKHVVIDVDRAKEEYVKMVWQMLHPEVDQK